MCNNNGTEGNCISEILKVILILQQNACPENCLDVCDRPMLGGGNNCIICNTRPVSLYTCCGNGAPVSMPTTKDTTITCPQETVLEETTTEACSTVFRVEKIEGNCCTFRVLAKNTDTTCCNVQPYLSTNSFFTVNLDCICMMRCLSDCFVDCVC